MSEQRLGPEWWWSRPQADTRPRADTWPQGCWAGTEADPISAAAAPGPGIWEQVVSVSRAEESARQMMSLCLKLTSYSQKNTNVKIKVINALISDRKEIKRVM